ncbi:MAG: glycerol-3-phosphate 1-O-acyltransferase PlsY [Lachnospiraceae bacterium]|jgi:glycerol-3-phosphate acyltransferase PlsY|nr:glycerol-3-phosphate 1-O-acyltransferase PlsY [Lachnospiraceae bacterium]
MASRIICLVIGYVLGLIQTGYFYGKAHHIDIREHGSGNAGTTNTLRTLGWKAGAVTFLGDLCKAMLAILIAWLLFRERYPESVKVLQMYGGLGAVLGHNFPFYMGFKGGKGIACTSGFILACFWQIAPICLALFILAVALTRYVSLGSILVVITFLIQLVVFVETGIIPIAKQCRMEVYILGAFFTLLALWKHRENIKRLLSGKENKFGMSKKEA